MKKIYTIIITVLVLVNLVNAQNFTLVPKQIKAQGASTKTSIEMYVNFTNLSTDVLDTLFTYEVIEVNIPSTWTLSICDPFACQDGSGKVGFNSNFILKNVFGSNSGFFKVDFVPNGAPGIGTTKIIVRSAKTGFADTIMAEGKVWNVAVKDNVVKQNKEFSFYPNPAKDELIIKYFAKENNQVEIYNILGSRVKTFSLFGNQTTVNIEELENGIYFIRLKDDGKIISRTFTKN